MTTVHLLKRHILSSLKRFLFRYLDVGLHAGPFPVGLGYRVNGRSCGDECHKVCRQFERIVRMGPAAGGLANDGRSSERLKVVGELLATREGLVADEDIDRLVLPVAFAVHL